MLILPLIVMLQFVELFQALCTLPTVFMIRSSKALTMPNACNFQELELLFLIPTPLKRGQNNKTPCIYKMSPSLMIHSTMMMEKENKIHQVANLQLSHSSQPSLLHDFS